LSERLAREVLRRAASGLRNALERPRRCAPRTLDVAEVGGRETGERQVVGRQRVLAGLVRRLLAVACSARGALVLGELALDPAEQDEHVRERALVAELASALQQLEQDFTRLFSPIRPPPVHGNREQRLREDAAVTARVLPLERLLGRLLRGLRTEQCLGEQPRAGRLCGERVVAEVLGEPRRGGGVLYRLVQTLAQTEEARRDALVRGCERLWLDLRLLDRL
jgi:hypothetical protein